MRTYVYETQNKKNRCVITENSVEVVSTIWGVWNCCTKWVGS